MAANVLIVLDLTGTFVFAISGATLGVRRKVDLFGVLVLSYAAATGGGIMRDTLIGATPPPSITDWRYMAVPALAGLITFYWYPEINRLKSPVLMFDAAGLGLFAVSGALKATTFGLGPVTAILLGMLTAIGGGIVRDVLVTKMPSVLTSELYAVAALAGATVMVLGERAGVPVLISSVVGAVLAFGLRMIAIRRRWGLPLPRHGEDAPPAT
jgi:uncharacterized membrane protein YeiH